MPAIPIVTAAAGLYSVVDGADKSRKAANQAADAAKAANQAAIDAKVDPAAVSAQAEQQALRNIELSRQTELKNNPENAQLRTQSINNLIDQLGQQGASPQLQALISSQIGQTNTYGGGVNVPGGSSYGGGVAVPTGNSFTGGIDVPPGTSFAGGANSSLLNDAIAKAQADLALGGNLPLDVRNLVARNAAAQGSRVGNIRLGGDISARDLGLTSLDLARQRLAAAQSLGQAQLGANQFNSNLQQGANQFDASLLQQALLSNSNQRQQAGQFDASLLQQALLANANQRQQANQFDTQAGLSAQQFNAGQRQQASQFDAGYALNQAQLLQQLSSGDYAKALSAAQFGQSLQTPVVGLDPSAIANLYVGNQNAQTQAGLQAAQLQASQAQGAAQTGGALFGAGLGALKDFSNSYSATAKPVVNSYQAPKASEIPYYGYGMPGYN